MPALILRGTARRCRPQCRVVGDQRPQHLDRSPTHIQLLVLPGQLRQPLAKRQHPHLLDHPQGADAVPWVRVTEHLVQRPEGPFDQRPVEARQDVLVYTGEVLSQPVEVAGSIEVILFVSSDARDTDFTVKLIDVFPDGRAINLDDTILRARYREGFDREVFLEDGEVYELRLGPLSTANVFAAGHRIRVEVSSSNFPRYDRNLNTGGSNYDESEPAVARNVVHHSREHPSRIVLPVLRR